MPQTRSNGKTLRSFKSCAGEAPEDLWAEMRARIWRAPLERYAFRDRLLELIPTLRSHLEDSRQLTAEWAPLGIEIRPVKMRARGLCSIRDDQRVVYVNREDRYELQRFTVAHEVAHLLLAGQESRRRPLSPLEEEALCEEFAGRLLIDREALARELGSLAEAPDPEHLLRLCGRFRVNVRPMQIAVGEQLAGTPYSLLLARRRGHWRRPAELAFRVEALNGARHSYLPRHQRLTSLGFSGLDAAAESASHGASFEGCDRSVRVEVRGLPRENSSASALGTVQWHAILQGNTSPFLLAVLDLGALAGSPWGREGR